MKSFWQAINPKAQDNIKQAMVLLYRMRWIAIIGQILISIVAQLYYGFLIPFGWILTIVGFELALQLTTAYRMFKKEIFPQVELFLHLVIDSLFLTGLMFLTGGANNPFTYLLLIPVALGSFMLRPNQLLMLTILACCFYSFLHFNYVPMVMEREPAEGMFNLHLVGMWANFGLSAILVAVLGLAARQIFIAQQAKIQSLREKQMKDEQVLSLGIISAGAAHELGTPLATMAIIADDLSHADNVDDETREDLALLRTQISRCEDIINNLSERSSRSREQIHGQSTIVENLAQRMTGLIDAWQVYRPQIQLDLSLDESLNNCPCHIETSVEQAISNLLDNAAEASTANQSNQLTLVMRCHGDHFEMTIQDYGIGIPESLKQQLGEQILESSKAKGFGWGYFLSNASIERAGGEVTMSENGHGTLTRILLPLEAVNADRHH
jgi:two-component system sensor histidine kinase RegB